MYMYLRVCMYMYACIHVYMCTCTRVCLCVVWTTSGMTILAVVNGVKLRRTANIMAIVCTAWHAID